MKLVINNDFIKKCGGGSSEYWFSYKDYSIRNITEINDSLDTPEDIGQTTYFVSIGLIPFLSVGNEEVVRAFVETIENKKLKANIEKESNEHFMETFWKYFNVYPELSSGLDDFSEKFVVKKAIEWCEENKIDYSVEI